MKRVFLVVLDSVGVGALPDAAKYGDEGTNTLGHIVAEKNPSLPNMQSLGLGLIENVGCALPGDGAAGAYGRAIEKSAGKDTVTGHWEISGLRLTSPFPTYPNGFPQDVIDAFEKAIGTKVLGNYPASGTAILDELGEEHLRTGYPIVYTSADSVFQIACNEAIYPIEKLYEMCQIARNLLQGKHGVGRVIARPFIGTEKGKFQRTGRRHDYSLEPIGETIMDKLSQKGFDTYAVGKIEDIFCMRGITRSDHAAGNPACIDSMLNMMPDMKDGLMFVNLVDFDSLYGHRRDVQGYADALVYFDKRLPEIQAKMGDEDLLILTADHGCDPSFLKTTDHTREYIPILCWKRNMKDLTPLGTRNSYADIAATIAELFGLEDRFDAESFANKL